MLPQRYPTPPLAEPSLVLCADGGGSKISVVIRTHDGLEVRGIAGPCNVLSIGVSLAIQNILLATYRALYQLPRSYLPDHFHFPSSVAILANQVANKQGYAANGGETPTSSPGTGASSPVRPMPVRRQSTMPATALPMSPIPSRPSSPPPSLLPALETPLFRYAWLAMAGVGRKSEEEAFAPYVMQALNIPHANLRITNDVNLLAAPALSIPGIKHIAAVVCGTGTVGRMLRIIPGARGLPFEDLAIQGGWGHFLGDEGSAFDIGRFAVRTLLAYADRIESASLYGSPPPRMLPIYRDLLSYFGTNDPYDLINLVALTGPLTDGLPVGDATSKRNAMLAGAARIVLGWAYPDERQVDQSPAAAVVPSTTVPPPSPPESERSQEDETTDTDESQSVALKLVRKGIEPLVELAIGLLGDGTAVQPETTVLALGGGLFMSKGHRQLLREGLEREGVHFADIVLCRDAAGEGARAIAKVEF